MVLNEVTGEWKGDYSKALKFDIKHEMYKKAALNAEGDDSVFKWYTEEILPELISKANDESGYTDLDSMPMSNLLFSFLID